MEYKLDCGCLLWSTRGHPDILFCPKHRAAPELYEVCKAVDDYLNAAYPDNLKRKKIMFELAEKAIAKVDS